MVQPSVLMLVFATLVLIVAGALLVAYLEDREDQETDAPVRHLDHPLDVGRRTHLDTSMALSMEAAIREARRHALSTNIGAKVDRALAGAHKKGN